MGLGVAGHTVLTLSMGLDVAVFEFWGQVACRPGKPVCASRIRGWGEAASVTCRLTSLHASFSTADGDGVRWIMDHHNPTLRTPENQNCNQIKVTWNHRVMYECQLQCTLIIHIVLFFKLLVLNGLLISMTFSSTKFCSLCQMRGKQSLSWDNSKWGHQVCHTTVICHDLELQKHNACLPPTIHQQS